MAKHSIYQNDPNADTMRTALRLTLTQHMTMATMTRAMQLARGAVKDELKRERVNP